MLDQVEVELEGSVVKKALSYTFSPTTNLTST